MRGMNKKVVHWKMKYSGHELMQKNLTDFLLFEVSGALVRVVMPCPLIKKLFKDVMIYIHRCVVAEYRTSEWEVPGSNLGWVKFCCFLSKTFNRFASLKEYKLIFKIFSYSH
jgi:hypothetical protein